VPRPKARGEELFGTKYVRSLQRHLLQLRAAHPHPNRTLFYDDVAVAYLLAFFTPTIRSLRTLEDFSQTPEMRQNTSVDRIPRSTLSDANQVFDPTLLEPVIEDLRARVPDLRRADPGLAELTRLAELTSKVRAADGSLFTVAANVTWALRRRRRNGKGRQASVRLNLQWASAAGVPEGVSVTGAGTSEAAALMRDLAPDLIYVLDRGYVNFVLLGRILHAGSDFVLRAKSNVVFVPGQERPLEDADRAAGVISDRIGRLRGSDACKPNDMTGEDGPLVREVVILDPETGQTVRLFTSILDREVAAHVVGALYRRRWSIELFFRWLKVHANFEHMISHSHNGVAIGFHVAVIAVLLIYVRTQRPVSKYAYTMLGFVAAGRATMDDILPILRERERQCELARQQKARRKAEAAKAAQKSGK
jgi:hypothetical protein